MTICTAGRTSARQAATATPGRDSPTRIRSRSREPNILFDTPGSITVDTQLPLLEMHTSLKVDGGPDQQLFFGQYAVNFGIVVESTGRDIDDVTISHINAQRFNYDGIQLCAKPNAGQGTCDGTISDVLIEDSGGHDNGSHGVFVYGTDIDGVEIDRTNAFGNSAYQLDVASSLNAVGSIKNLTINNSEGSLGGISAILVSAGTIDGVTFSGVSGFFHQNGIEFVGNDISNVTMSNTETLDNTNHAILFRNFTNSSTTGSVSNVTINSATLHNQETPRTPQKGILFQEGTVSGITLNDVTLGDMITGLEVQTNVLSGLTVDGMTGRTVNETIMLNPTTSAANLIIRNSEISSIDGLGSGAISISHPLFGTPMIDSLVITGNTIEQSDDGAIRIITQKLNALLIQNNTIRKGTGDDGAVILDINGDGSNNLIKGNEISGNAGPGIFLCCNASQPGSVRVTDNKTFGNDGLGIDLSPVGVNNNDAGDTHAGINGLLNFPEIVNEAGGQVSGTSCASCKIDLYLSDKDASGDGEGKQLVASTIAGANGDWSVSVCNFSFPANPALTATATLNDGTSEFGPNFSLTAVIHCASGTPSASPTPTLGPSQNLQGDLNCDSNVDGLDAILALAIASGIQQSPIQGCPAVGSGSPKFGDVDCKGSVDSQDALAILAYAGGTSPVDQQQPCTDVGAVLPS
ncbi:MAG: hypothetical protein ABI559_01825 [Chloroflexota bacterium]